jgi:hypothetical protein
MSLTVEVVDLIARGIRGFSFTHVPHAPLYTRLSLTNDDDPAGCLRAEVWFQENVLSDLTRVVSQLGEVSGKYCMGALELTTTT